MRGFDIVALQIMYFAFNIAQMLYIRGYIKKTISGLIFLYLLILMLFRRKILSWFIRYRDWFSKIQMS